MFDISNEKYVELRLILEKQNGRPHTFEEAKDIGNGLIDFYELLWRLDVEEEEMDDAEVNES